MIKMKKNKLNITIEYDGTLRSASMLFLRDKLSIWFKGMNYPIQFGISDMDIRFEEEKK